MRTNDARRLAVAALRNLRIDLNNYPYFGALIVHIKEDDLSIHQVTRLIRTEYPPKKPHKS